MRIEFGVFDVWILIPTVAIDLHFKKVGFVWLKWCMDILF